MSSIATKANKSADAMNSKRRYQKPFTITTSILDHRDGHYVRPNKVAFKYSNFKKDVNLDVHVIVLNFVVKVNVKTYKEYIINVFNYTLKDTTSDWCHNYMLEFLDYILLKFT